MELTQAQRDAIEAAARAAAAQNVAPLTDAQRAAIEAVGAQLGGQNREWTGGANQVLPERTLLHRIGDNLIGYDDGVMSPGEKLGTALGLAVEGGTMGLVGDEANAFADQMLGRGDYDERRDFYRQQEEQLQTENPLLAAGAEIGGALAFPLGAARIGGSLAARAALSAGLGGAMGASYGFMEGEGGAEERLQDAGQQGAFGAVIGGMIPFAGQGIQRLANALTRNVGIRRAAQAAPTMDDLRAQAQALYARAEQSPPLSRGALSGQVAAMEARALREGMDPILTPGATRIMENMTDVATAPGQQGIGFRELDTLRRQAGIPAGNIGNPTEARLGAMMQEGIDDFVDNADPQLSAIVGQARDMWGRLRRSEVIQTAIERAERQASGFENGLRVQFRQILNNPRLSRGFGPDELAAMEAVVRGTPFGNILRQIGKLGIGLHGNSNALGATAGAILGGSLGGPIGSVVIPAIGTAARAGADATTRNAAEIAQALVRMGGRASYNQIGDDTRNLLEALMRRSSQPVIIQ